MLIPYPDAVDMDLFSYALATMALPERGKHFNFLVVHFTRVDDGPATGRFGSTHHQQMETPRAEEQLDDITWMRDALAELDVCVLP